MSDLLQTRCAQPAIFGSCVLWALVAFTAMPASGESNQATEARAAVRAQPAKAFESTRAKTHSLVGLTDGALQKLIANDVESLGSLSIGLPNNGRLLNGEQPEDGALFEIVAPDFSWGTKETVEYLSVAAAEVQRRHADTPPLHIGHISKKTGGYLSPHLSHQSGRDVDVGYYYSNKRAWYRRATWNNLDTPRTWTLVKALVLKTDVDLILIDASIQSLLRKHAEQTGEDKDWLHRIFKGSPDRPAIIRHARGHATHIHVRFFSPEAQRNAQRAYPLLIEEDLVPPVVVYQHHKVKKGETLGRLAKMYGTTVEAIQQANGLRGTTIQAKRVYKIPARGGPTPVDGPLSFPPRQLP
jgi:penicillin-insensitive murein endopeptidase